MSPIPLRPDPLVPGTQYSSPWVLPRTRPSRHPGHLPLNPCAQVCHLPPTVDPSVLGHPEPCSRTPRTRGPKPRTNRRLLRRVDHQSRTVLTTTKKDLRLLWVLVLTLPLVKHRDTPRSSSPSGSRSRRPFLPGSCRSPTDHTQTHENPSDHTVHPTPVHPATPTPSGRCPRVVPPAPPPPTNPLTPTSPDLHTQTSSSSSIDVISRDQHRKY